ncbi:hypothetical protein LOH54_00075 [Sulfurimonas sp. HSL-3221]|uniref:hypothetical protein n=1 Tax=Sulfurimonadaceae TaxID=2771471 RepID=UPI001E31E402|nr:hypothetical protein [Sulfurimonas sp. HSL-3221]UFS62545.1 hypothetical protein LOH54_00075 [Sulfurimonas sp. HSL-3221]
MDISAGVLWDIFKHTGSWLINLGRAGEARKRQSVTALRNVITAARETSVYIRQVRDTGKRDHAAEKDLTLLWTELGFALHDLGIEKLARRCQIKGKEWSDPEQYNPVFLEKAHISLERMERIAKEILRQIEQ